MNMKQLAEYDNSKKSTTVAYILGFLTWFIPLGLHKWYSGQDTMAACYTGFGVLWFITLVSQSEEMLYIFTVATIPYSICMIIDAFTTRDHIKEYNNKLINKIEVE